YLTGVSAYIERVAAGNDWAAPGVACCGNLIFIGWRPNHAYSVGDVVSNSGQVIQCIGAGTSSGSNPPFSSYGATITDGSAQWKAVAPHPFYNLQIDSNTTQVQIFHSDMTGAGTAGIAMTNTVANGSAPTLVQVSNTALGGNLQAGFLAQVGSGLMIS